MTAPAAAIAAALPNYEVGDELGRGGFGVVYLGKQRALGRPVAIKQLPPALANDAMVRSRFASEARLLASLDHPHVVPVYDYVEHDGLCLLVMECLPGGTVWDVFRKEGLSPQRACAVVIATASGLHHAHSHGVLHRDVKPENLLLSSSQHLKVSDFGIAQMIGGGDAVTTSAGGVLGTPAYMAPEQAAGRTLGPAADVYAVGVMLYELFSGQLPFSQEGGGLAVLYRHVYEQPVPIGQYATGIPTALSDVVMRAIARDPDERYASAEELAVALGEAAVAAFGPDWYAASGLKVVGSDRVMTTLTAGVQTRAAAPPTTTTPPATTPPALGSGAQALVPAPTPPPPRAALMVHPRAVSHEVGGVSMTAEPEPLIAVRQLFDIPKAPRELAIATIISALLLLAAAFFGIATSASHSSTVPGAVTVGGANVTAGDHVTADFGKPIAVRVSPASRAHSARLALSAAGVPIGKSDQSTLVAAASGATGSLSVGAAKHLVAGPVSGTLTFYASDGHAIGAQHLQIAPSGSGFVTIPGVVIVLLLLFALAYLESLVRPMWRLARARVAGMVGLALTGALLGIVLTGLAWVLGRYQPNIASAVVCAVLGAAFGVLTGLTAARGGLRSRVRRLNKRYPFEQFITGGQPPTPPVR